MADTDESQEAPSKPGKKGSMVTTALALSDSESSDLAPEELVDQGEALRILRCNRATLHRMVLNGEVTAHQRPNRLRLYERAELEGIVGKAEEGNVLREATMLLRQAHSHAAKHMDHQERMMDVLAKAAGHFMELTRQHVTSIHERAEKLEVVVSAQADKIREADRAEMDQAIRMLEAEQAAERSKAMLRAGEAAIPILLARMTHTAEARDTAIAQGVRALASDPELVASIRAALPAEKLGLVDALLESATAKTAAAEPAK